jgi:hypothetical protein
MAHLVGKNFGERANAVLLLGIYGAGLRVASSARAVLRHCLLVPGLVSRTGTEPTIIEAIDSYLVIPRSEGLSTGSYPR